LRGLAPVLGVFGVSWAVVLTAAAIATAFIGRPHRWRILSAAMVGLWLLGGALTHMGWTVPRGGTLTVSLIQGNIPQDVKWTSAARAETMERYLAMTRPALDSDVVIWPETAVPTFLHQVYGQYLAPLDAEARARGAMVLIGAPVLDPDGQRYYNSLVAIGQGEGSYSKHHLVPFGEFVPLEGLLRPVIDMIDIPLSGFSPGEGHGIPIRRADVLFSASICYEDIFGGEIARRLGEAGVLVNVSNDAWFGDSAAPHQHLEMARMRALETGRVMLRATNTGVSAIVDHSGRIRRASPQFEPHVLTDRIVARRGHTPYGIAGDASVLVLLALCGVGWLAARYRPGRLTGQTRPAPAPIPRDGEDGCGNPLVDRGQQD
jgi:apolipoprotein N-acyltransferase